MGVAALADLQDKLYAQDRWAVLPIFQAMDAAGKDGAIKHMMSGVNPQGCQVFSFKAPSAEDLDHDYISTSVNSGALMKKSFHASKRNLVRSLKLSVEGRPQNTLKWCERRVPVKALSYSVISNSFNRFLSSR